jgi:hypothetical protein
MVSIERAVRDIIEETMTINSTRDGSALRLMEITVMFLCNGVMLLLSGFILNYPTPGDSCHMIFILLNR